MKSMDTEISGIIR
ncbi:hypothetical protein ACTFIW_009812 [Dictyostelium discoideum]